MTATDRRVPFGVYVHVPFCPSRCGYCAFNTYTVSELGSTRDLQGYVDAAIGELRIARQTIGDDRPASTVFVGGGTPTILPPADLVRIVDAVGIEFGLAAGAEITVEANPDSIDRSGLAALREGGFNRVSFGMQSVRTHVLAVLDRTHTPGRAEQAVADARAAGFEHINLDVIYGTPGESDDDWAATVDAVLATAVDHVSAYALTLEPGTRLSAQVRQGRLDALDDGALAARYYWLDERLAGAGFDWYELSNWARGEAAQCRHNLIYWRGDDWWGVGPGAHSHLAGRRWYNVAHPRDYAARIARGEAPEAEPAEILDAQSIRLEQVMTRIRLAEGCPTVLFDRAGKAAATRAVADGLLEAVRTTPGVDGPRVRLTAHGRQLADHVLRQIV
ncbi:MAG TPA: radical SAM family heme chaperone HemW [Acidimicrobiales bacterium]|nr:radical SAM family heme chaperone HemW [Acidimicrobiales bacterium]